MQVDISARIEASNPVFHKRASRQHHNGHITSLRSNRFADGITAHAREHQIQYDQIDGRISLSEMIERGLPIGHRCHLKILGLKIKLDAKRQMFFIINDENSWHEDGLLAEVQRVCVRAEMLPRQHRTAAH